SQLLVVCSCQGSAGLRDLLSFPTRRSSDLQRGERLRFGGVGNRDVYNITAPFTDRGEPVIAGRVERRDSEDSEVMFFREQGGVWHPRRGDPVFPLQDPFFSRIHGELVGGGVETRS